MKFHYGLTLMFLAFALPSAAQSGNPRENLMADTVAVGGVGKVMLVPDRYSFSVGVQSIAPAVEDAVNENNRRMSAVIAALRKAGAAEKEIRTANFSIWPQQDYSKGDLPRILGYQVSNTLTVTRDKVGDAGKLLQAALGAGVNQASGIQFEISDPALGREKGLKAAFEDARAKALNLAQAAGRTLGIAIAISEGSQPMFNPPVPMQRGVMAAKAEAISQVPIEGGSQEQVYNVSVVFALK